MYQNIFQSEMGADWMVSGRHWRILNTTEDGTIAHQLYFIYFYFFFKLSMTTLRAFCAEDLFKFNNINLDPLTGAYCLFFVHCFNVWPID